MAIRAINELTEKIIGPCIEIHFALVPGWLESAYEECLCYELSKAKIAFERQKSLPIQYKGVKLDCGYRLDILVEKKVIVEVKAVDKILPIHEAQILTYLKISNLSVGLLINFNSPTLKEGIKRLVNNFVEIPNPVLFEKEEMAKKKCSI